MRISSRMLGAALLGVAAAAMAVPALAQQDAPPAGQTPPANGPGTPQPGASSPGPPPAAPGAPAPAAPDHTARSAVVIANVNLRSAPGTDAEILATIPAGSRVRVADCSEWCMVTWNGQSGFAIARNLDIGGARQARGYRAPPRYAGGPPGVYEAGPPVVYGPPVYYPPPAVVYAPPPYYYGPRYYGWRRGWW